MKREEVSKTFEGATREQIGRGMTINGQDVQAVRAGMTQTELEAARAVISNPEAAKRAHRSGKSQRSEDLPRENRARNPSAVRIGQDGGQRV